MAAKLCTYPGCFKLLLARGWCATHYMRWRKHGDPSVVYPSTKKKTGCITPAGYRIITVDRKRVMEHRWVMSQHLARPLLDTEVIHHRNGDRLDNRLENLALTTPGAHSKIHGTFRSPTHKQCCECLLILPRTDFTKAYRNCPPTHDPHNSSCKECYAARMRKKRGQPSTSIKPCVSVSVSDAEAADH